MGRKAIQVEEDVFKEVRAMYPDLSWTEILRQYVLLPRGLPKDSPRGDVPIDGIEVYATKDDLKALKDKFSMVLTQLIDKNKLKR
tara:strand:- start:292 stop:546 length:255 start_codon:yes stop_codon:yes gene_type:complete